MDKEAQKRLADDFVELLRTTNRDGIEELIRYLQEETDFFTAPASAKYHGAFESGLLMHSINVCAELNLDPNSKVYPPETLIIVALLHDICKANCYRTEKRNVKENGVWVEKQIYSCHSVTVKNRCTSQANSLSFPMRRLQLSAGTWEHSTTHSAAATGD